MISTGCRDGSDRSLEGKREGRKDGESVDASKKEEDKRDKGKESYSQIRPSENTLIDQSEYPISSFKTLRNAPRSGGGKRWSSTCPT